MKKIVFYITLCTILQGCASVVGTATSGNFLCGAMTQSGSGGCYAKKNLVYIGVRTDVKLTEDAKSVWLVLPIVDLPMSTAMDTIFLPYTITRYFW